MSEVMRFDDANSLPVERGNTPDWATPASLAEAMQFAKIMAGSDMVPKEHARKPGNVLVAMQVASQLKVPLLPILQNLAVINGKPSIWGDLALALVKAHPECRGVHEEFDDARMIATCTVQRGDQTPVARTFSMDDAKQAGLSGKSGPWKQYPKRMLQMRARGFALRDSFPDALKGLQLREEAEDIPQQRQSQIPADAPQSGIAGLQAKLAAKDAYSEPTITVAEPEPEPEFDPAADAPGVNDEPELSPRETLFRELKKRNETLRHYSVIIEEISGKPLDPMDLPDDEHWPEIAEAIYKAMEG